MKRGRRKGIIAGSVVVLLLILVLIWNWDWFKPIAEAQASAALGRKVTIQHLHVHLALKPTITLDHIVADNPAGFPGSGRFGTVDALAVQIDPWALLHHGVLLPRIDVAQPNFDLEAPPGAQPNWTMPASKPSPPDAKPYTVQIGLLTVENGQLHFVDPAFKSDFKLDIHTVTNVDVRQSRIDIDATGTYAGQPVTAHFVGGSIITMRDSGVPYPLSLEVENGPTRLAVKGTLTDPLKFGGADISLLLKGSDMELLYPLTSVPFPHTPPFELKGTLDYANQAFRFRDFTGTVGNSDLNGLIAVAPYGDRRKITADLTSKRVDLADLSGFLGSKTPGDDNLAGQTAAQQQAREAKKADPNLLPDTPISLPRLRAADVDLHYKAAHIEGKSMPLDNLVVHLQIVDGNVKVSPLNFGVGGGTIASNVELDTTQDDQIHLKADTDFREVDFGHIIDQTSVFKGAGKIGGRADIDATGKSVAAMAANGNGNLILSMTGGNLSSLLIDLVGLDLGNGVLSAVGIPSRAKLRCMITDFGLKEGIVDTRLLLFDTTEANIVGSGDINLKNETIDYQLKTQPKHFNIGSLPAPIDIKGPLKNPSIRPDATALGLRGGAAIALGILATPLAALIPTIQLGLGKNNDCKSLLDEAENAEKNIDAKAPAVERSDKAVVTPKWRSSSITVTPKIGH